MQVQELGPGTACYLVSEASGTRSREVVTIAQGQNLLPGAVLGKVTTSGEYTAVSPANDNGSQTAIAVLFAAVDSTAAAHAAVITARDAEVAAHALAWPAGTTEPQKTAALAQLAAVGIVAR